MLPMVRRARSATTKQSSGRASHGQACAQCYNEAVEKACFKWSGVRAVLQPGVRAVLQRSSRAGVLPMVRRACSAITKQSSNVE